MGAATRFDLVQKDIPQAWYNITADFPTPMAPHMHPGTQQPAKPEDMLAIFPPSIVEQEFSTERWIPIPEEIRDVLSLWRPTPLMRSVRLEKALDTPAHIYYKYEGASPAGSHKPNSAVPQAWYNRKDGVKRLATETGAGQWGSSLAMACKLFGLECIVYMVASSYRQKPYRRMAMETWGATCHSSPSQETAFGRKIREEDPHTVGSLGIAISEAVEDT
ncbi:MAG TPA: pyridoxal-phosphate dependent enzyme, partial [Fibrobacteria bacterium]|nr:pyridoxal-phosphate dependent enzyme [Fibrobacteria bacterium]